MNTGFVQGIKTKQQDNVDNRREDDQPGTNTIWLSVIEYN